ncbi:hypothetical protein ACA910_010570 [Epithemia clementina (nom. ined.)]
MWNALGLIGSVATIAWSLLTKKDADTLPPPSTAPPPSSNRSSSSLIPAPLQLHLSPQTRIFLAGIAFTLGIQHAYRWLVRNGYYQSLKFMLLSPLYNGYISCLDKRDIPLRKPLHLLPSKNVKTQKQNGDKEENEPQLPPDYEITSTEYGSVTRLLSPDLAVATTDTLHISLISIRPNCEMPSQTSPPYAEFYYVISGSGLVSQQGVIETLKVQAGQAFVVDPLSMRWISCSSRRPAVSSGSLDEEYSKQMSEDDTLVLLRVTDGGSLYSKEEWNQIRLDPVYTERLLRSSSGTTLAMASSFGRNSLKIVSQGLARVQKLAAGYAASNSSSNSDYDTATTTADR